MEKIAGSKILVTGAAGFIGFHLSHKLASLQASVIGIDNINDYYDTNLKYARLADLGIQKTSIVENTSVVSDRYSNYQFCKMDLTNADQIVKLFRDEKFDYVINLAAQAGVRYSLKNPAAYISANIEGFLNILEACRNFPVRHLVYASSSSVYGINRKIPFSVADNVDHPISLYASTKKSNELMAHTYSHLFNIPTTGLRFFTVYGPWGRPDMAYYSFSKNIMEGRSIKVYNNGEMRRDFTFISDIVDGIVSSLTHIPQTKSVNGESDEHFLQTPYRVFNLGNNQPVNLMEFIRTLEHALDKEAVLEFEEMQDGDVPETWADIDETQKILGYDPKVAIGEGLKIFSDWYKTYHKYGTEE